VLAHLAGLLGLSVVGWAVAAAISGALVVVAGERRSRYLVLQSGQACIYQLGVLAADALIISLLLAGFLYYVDELPGMPNISSLYINETLAAVLAVAWVVIGLLSPVWHLLTVYWSVRATARAAKGQEVVYPFVTVWFEDRVLPAGPASAAPTAEAGAGAGSESEGGTGKQDGVPADDDPDAGWRPPPPEAAGADGDRRPPPKGEAGADASADAGRQQGPRGDALADADTDAGWRPPEPEPKEGADPRV
jgi:hypothetical protein